jgi:hypothetical protein
MRALIFSESLSETFRILTRIQRDIIIRVHTSACKSTHYSCQMLLQSERFFRHIFETFLNTKFHENPSSGSRLVACRQTHDEANSLFPKFCKRAYKFACFFM